MPIVSAIIVTYNSASTIRRCLASLPAECETIVVDNASTDGTREAVGEFARARLIVNDKNLGFGAANNLGLKAAAGDYALLLNPDAWAHSPESVEMLAQFMDSHPQAVACGGLLRFPNGAAQLSAARELTLSAVFFEQTLLEKLPGFSPYWIPPSNEPRRVAQVMGACIMLSRIDGEFPLFDERFFLYCEDTELCKRVSARGEIWYVPPAEFGHDLGASSEESRWRAVAFYNRGKELYFEIHHGKFAALICFSLNRCGALLRLGIWAIATLATLGLHSRFRLRVALFARVLFAAKNPYPDAR